MMMHFLYNLLVTLLAPFGALWLALSSRYRPLLERFAPSVPDGLAGAVWIHACSVGEINTARPLIRAMNRRWPGTKVFLTVSTVTGREWASQIFDGVAITFSPFDLPRAVKRFYARLRPRALLLVETELWPNVLFEAKRLGVPVLLVNGRVSDKHYRRDRLVRGFMKQMLEAVSAACMQNEEYAQRLISLGAAPATVHVTGNTKFDGVATQIDEGKIEQIRTEMGFGPNQPVLTFGSTRPGDEALAARCWKTLREEFPALRLVIALRHAERLAEARACFTEPVLIRSRVAAGQAPAGERILFVDTVGELTSFYALSSLVVIGGSFFPGVNGHNPIESAALGIPTVFGPYMRNFIDPARELVKYGGAVQVENADLLESALRHLLHDTNAREQLSVRGREAVRANQGAIEKTLDILDSYI